MADPSGSRLIGGHYRVDADNPLPEAGGGLPAFAATDTRGAERGTLMALRVGRPAPARARALQIPLAGIENLLLPLAHGLGSPIEGQDAYHIVCQAPPGPPVSASPRPWPETALIERVLRPIAAILEDLHARGLTHRAIRPNNVFLAPSNRPVTLGAAWAAPPAMHQPAVCEPPYAALCHPAARGEGHAADDVYALGVLLVTLALGRAPLEGLDPVAIAHRKLELGDFAAITGGERLPPLLTDIVRGMLADDPGHRPQPMLLRDPASARGRRVVARPPPRAARPFLLGPLPVWNNRTLALAMALAPSEAVSAIQTGTMMYWLRRGLGDALLAVKLEEMLRQHIRDSGTGPREEREDANAMLAMRAIAAADGLMPLCWRGFALFPDGLGAALALAAGTGADMDTGTGTGTGADTGADLTDTLQTLILTEATATWSLMREEHVQGTTARVEARQRRAIAQIQGPAGGLPRLTYTLNPLLPCASPLLAGRWVAAMSDLAPALDAIVAASPGIDPLEPHVAAFIAARSERWLEQEVKGIAPAADPARQTLNALRLLSALQHRFHPAPLPGLTAWIAARAAPLTGRWRNRERRAAVEERLRVLAAAGFLPPLLALLDDPADQAADAAGLRAAHADLVRLDAELRALAEGAAPRAALAARLGQEIAAGLGLAVIAATLLFTALG